MSSIWAESAPAGTEGRISEFPSSVHVENQTCRQKISLFHFPGHHPWLLVRLQVPVPIRPDRDFKTAVDAEGRIPGVLDGRLGVAPAPKSAQQTS